MLECRELLRGANAIATPLTENFGPSVLNLLLTTVHRLT